MEVEDIEQDQVLQCPICTFQAGERKAVPRPARSDIHSTNTRQAHGLGCHGCTEPLSTATENSGIKLAQEEAQLGGGYRRTRPMRCYSSQALEREWELVGGQEKGRKEEPTQSGELRKSPRVPPPGQPQLPWPWRTTGLCLPLVLCTPWGQERSVPATERP